MLSLIVPFFNEEKNIVNSYKILQKYLEKLNKKYELIYVNDGSTDNSYIKLKKVINRKYVKIINYNKNRGRGYAVILGFSHAKGDMIGYIDADLEISPKYIKPCLKKLEIFDAVIVSKHHPSSEIQTTFLRKKASLLFNFWMRLILSSNIRDHQAGLKLFRKKVIEKILPMVKSPKWFFDVELLYYVQMENFSIYEQPIKIKYGFHNLRWSFITGFLDSLLSALNLRFNQQRI